MTSDIDQAPKSAAEMVLLDAWVEDNPGSRAALKLAQACMSEGRHGRAREILGKYLALHSNDLGAMALMARAREQAGDMDGAVAQLQAAAAELAAHAGVFADLARLLAAKGRDREAADAVAVAQALQQRAEASALDNGLESATMASIYAAQGHTDRAEAIYRKLSGPKSGGAEPAKPSPRPENPGEGKVIRRLEFLADAARKRSLG